MPIIDMTPPPSIDPHDRRALRTRLRVLIGNRLSACIDHTPAHDALGVSRTWISVSLQTVWHGMCKTIESGGKARDRGRLPARFSPGDHDVCGRASRRLRRSVAAWKQWRRAGCEEHPRHSARVLILASAMFRFIGAKRTAAVVLCDLGSTAYYIGGIVESQIGKAAPWFILAVMLFSYAVRSVYIESCSMFVRGGVYRVVKEAMGHGMAKVSVSALMFDYVLTGPISAVSAGHYLVKLVNSFVHHFGVHFTIDERLGAAGVAVAVVLYFYQINVRGIPESSTKALNIMKATTLMAVVVIAWCLVTLAVRPETRRSLRWHPSWARSSTAKASRRSMR